mgnify:CR=1 FL=1
MAKRYVITHRKDDGVWQVKLAKGAKVIKLFNTQKEAIDYAETLAENQDGSITIHKKDGKIRKQNYQQKKPAKEEQPEAEEVKEKKVEPKETKKAVKKVAPTPKRKRQNLLQLKK